MKTILSSLVASVWVLQGCTQQKETPQTNNFYTTSAQEKPALASSKSKTAVSKAKNTTSASDQDETTITFDKKFLGKDLILGGAVSNFDSEFDNIEGPGWDVGHFLPTRLVRLSLTTNDDGEDVLLLTRSPRRPWAGANNGVPFEGVIDTIAVEDSDDTTITLKKKDLASTFSVSFQYEGVGGGDENESPTTHEKASVTEDTIVLPVHQRTFVPEDSSKKDSAKIRLNVLNRFFLKIWKPNEGFVPQKASSSYGYFTLEDMYYRASGSYKSEVENNPDDIILKRDLRKPITYVLSKTTPERYRKLIKEAADAWNPELKKLSGQTGKYITVVDESPEHPAVFGDPDYNVIYWEADITKGGGGMRAAWANDPITGEIFATNVWLGGARLVKELEDDYDLHVGVKYDNRSVSPSMTTRRSSLSNNIERFTKDGHFSALNETGKLKLLENIHRPSRTMKFRESKRGENRFFSACEGIDMGIASTSLDLEKPKVTKDEYVNGWIRINAMHEIGHTLGLRHNFFGGLSYVKGKSESDGSVMDYVSDSQVYRGEELKSPGRYDIQALEYGYANKLLAKADRAPFCTDDETTPSGGTMEKFDARCKQWSEGANPLRDFWTPGIIRNYIAYNVETDPSDKIDLFNRFGNNLMGTAMAFGGSQYTSSEDKKNLSDAIADVLAMEEFQDSATGKVSRFEDLSPAFEGTRQFVVLLYLNLAAVWKFDEGEVFSAKLATAMARYIAHAGSTSKDDSDSAKELMIDFTARWLRNSKNAANRKNAYQFLVESERLLKQKLQLAHASPAEDSYELAQARGLINIIKQRKELFIGSKLDKWPDVADKKQKSDEE